MIIELSPSLVEMAQKSSENLRLVTEKLELLWLAQREGNHILFAEIDVAESLLSIIGQTSSSARSLLQRLVNQYPKTASLAYYVLRKLLVGEFSDRRLELRDKVIHCHPALINSNMIQKSILLVENLNDADFYEWITRQTFRKSEFGTVHLEFEGYPGGGDTTANAYTRIKEKSFRLCLCIVDSDIRAPGTEPGTTAKKVLLDDKKNPLPRAQTHVISVCSIENLIPFSAYEHVWQDDLELTNRLDTYRAHYRDGHWRYLQLKKHTTCFEIHGESAFSKYWRPLLSQSTEGCTDKICATKKHCEQKKLIQLSSSPLSATQAHLENISIEITDLLPDIRSAWEMIAIDILTWCCAPPRSAVA